MLSVLVLLSALSTAHAEMPPPPEPQSDEERRVYDDLRRWHESFTRGDCTYGDSGVVGRLRGLGEKVGYFPAYLQYYNTRIVPKFNEMNTGVPGYGTWKEIEARRVAGMKWLAETPIPEGPASTREEVAAYVQAYKDYAAHAAEEHAWVDGLMKASSCHRNGTPPPGTRGHIPGLHGYDGWRHGVSPAEVSRRLNVVRDQLAPGGAGMASRVERLVKRSEGSFDSYAKMGAVITDAANAWRTLDAAQQDADIIPMWAELFDGERKQQLLAAPAEMESQKKALEGVIARLLPQMKVPPAGGGAEQKAIASGLMGQPLSWRVASDMRTEDRQERHPERPGSTYRLAFQSFDVYMVEPREGNWPDIPGASSSEVCNLRGAAVRNYSAALDEPLGTWQVKDPYTVGPILCANKDSTGAFSH